MELKIYQQFFVWIYGFNLSRCLQLNPLHTISVYRYTQAVCVGGVSSPLGIPSTHVMKLKLALKKTLDKILLITYFIDIIFIDNFCHLNTVHFTDQNAFFLTSAEFKNDVISQLLFSIRTYLWKFVFNWYELLITRNSIILMVAHNFWSVNCGSP